MKRSAFGLLAVLVVLMSGSTVLHALSAVPESTNLARAFAKSDPARMLRQEPPPDPIRPNIIVILADDMGFSDLGCYGSEIQTPVLDQLAANGRQFHRFYNTAKCSPSRASLLTGQYPHAAGMENLTTSGGGNSPAYLGYLSPNTVTLAEVLGAEDYGTYLSGKWHVGEQQNQGRWPTDRGFDRYWGLISGANSFFEITPGEGRQMALDNQQWDPDTDYTTALMQQHGRDDFYITDATADFAIDFLTEHQSNRPADPFFLYMSFTAPHWPLHAYPEDIAKYDGVYNDGWDEIRAERLQKMIDNGLLPAGTPLSNRDGQAWNNIPADDGDMDIDKDKGDRAFRMQTYAAQIDRMDQDIGKLVDYLQSIGELDNTLILFMADNGGSAENVEGRNNHQSGAIVGTAESYMSYLKEWSNASNTPFRLHKNFVEEGGIATPLIAHWPDGINNPGSQTDQIGHVKDIMATILDITGIAYPTTLGGNTILPMSSESFAPVFNDPQAVSQREIFFEYNNRRAVRSGPWKILSSSANGSWSLYNLEDDPIEVTNLAGTYPKIVQQLSERYELWETSVGHQSGSLPNPTQSPVLANPFADQVLTPNGAFSFDIPENTFSDEGIDVFRYSATLSDGSPLPDWLDFEPITGTFSGTAPSELVIPLAIQLTVIDWNENTATDDFLINLNNFGPSEILYREVFGNNNTETNPSNGIKEPLNPVADAGWTSYVGPSATLVVNFGREDNPPKVQVSGFDGRPGNLDNVNAGPTLDQVSGFLFGSLTESPVLSYTEEYSLDLAAYEDLEFSWYQGHNNASTTYLTIRIDGQWFVSAVGQTNTAVSSATLFSTQAELKTVPFDPAATNWNTLDFDPMLGQLSVGATASTDLPAGQLDAFGLLTEGTLNSLRLDAFTITGSATAPGVADLQVNPATIDFGSVEPGSGSAPQPVALSNAGGSPLQITSITLTEDPDGVFALAGLPVLPLTLTANETLTDAFSVSFTPQAVGAASAKILIDSGDPDEAVFEITLDGAGAVPICSPISTLPCSQVPLSLPVVFNFGQDEGGLADQNGAGIGFTAVMEHSEARRAGDLPVSNPQVNGYEPSLLTLNTTDGHLEMVSQAGIAFRDPPESSNNNNQVNTLGVGLQGITEPIVVQTTLKSVNTGTGFAQFGLWFGFDEDNFVKFNIQNSDLALRVESGGITEDPDQLFAGGISGLPGADVTLELEIDPINLTAKGFYTVGTGERTQIQDANGDFLPIPADYVTGRTLPEVGNTTFAGIFITHRNGNQFTGAVDHFSVEAIAEPVPDPTPALAAMGQQVQTNEDEPVAITLQSGTDFAEAVLDQGEAHYSNAISEYNVGQFPRSADNGNLNTTGASSWTSGFFPGLLWYFYEYTGDNTFQQAALNWTATLENQKNNTGTHDVGFIIGSSFGNGLRLLEGSTEVEDYDAIIIQAAESLISRYDPTIGAIRSWDFGSWNYPVIIDNMMNLELLFLASELSGDPKYREVAIDHANTTLEQFFRPDGSSYHVVNFDDDGSVISKGTHQGAGPETAWARGQAWGLYGFTMAYRETGIIAYKEIALTIADFILSETFPDLIIPYWDYSVSGNEPRDASAAAITASALLELMHYDTGKRATYFEAALSILDALNNPEYSAEPGTNNNFILRHSVGNKPGNSEIDVPIIYADYYYVEAQLRLRAMQPEGPVTFSLDNLPSEGNLNGTAPELTYVPNPDFSGTDQFTFTVNTGQLQSNTATVEIDVVPVVETLPVWYRKVFSNATQANQPAAAAEWALYGGSNGTAITAFDGSTTPRGGVGFATGKPIDQHDAANGLQVLVPDQELGYVYIFNDGPIDYLAYTEQTLDRSQYEPTQITWYQGHNRSDMESRVAVRIAGQWYISTEGFTNPAVTSGGDFSAQAEQKTFAFTTMASAWQTLDFSAGNVLAPGDGLTAQLPGGDIEAFGLYVLNSSTNESKTLRFDTYEIQVTDTAPLLFNVTGGGTYCSDEVTAQSIGLDGSQSNVNYTLSRDGSAVETIAGTGSALSFTAQSTPGTYTVVAAFAAGNPNETNMMGSAVVATELAPTIFNVTGGGSYCPGSPQLFSIGLDGSQTTVEYTLIRDGNEIVETLTGTGSTLTITSLSTPGTYTVEAASLVGQFCTATMQGGAIIIEEIANVSLDLTVSQQAHTDHSGMYDIQLYSEGDLENPVYSFQEEADASGLITLNNLDPGSYQVWTKHPQSVSLIEFINLDACTNSGAVGPLPMGDVNDDNSIDLTDFSIFASVYGLFPTDMAYNSSANFNEEEEINLTDFSIFASNYDRIGQAPVMDPISLQSVDEIISTNGMVSLSFGVTDSATTIGEVIPVDVYLHAADQLVNGLRATIAFPGSAFEVLHTELSGNMEIVLENYVQENKGTISWTLGTLEGGINKSVYAGRIYLEAREEGKHPISFLSESSMAVMNGVSLPLTLENRTIEVQSLTTDLDMISGTDDVDFTLFPNPGKGLVRATIRGNSNLQSAVIRVLDVRGRLIRHIPLNGEDEINIHLENEPDGLYFIQLQTGSHYLTKRYSKQ